MLFGLFFPIAEPNAAQVKQDAPEAKFALLVGINKYDDAGISTLGGTLNDVKLMRDLLIDPEVGYNFRDDDVMELLSPSDAEELVSPEMSRAGKPTRDNIKNAFQKHLIDNARKFKEKNPTSDGATILFYFSGHGSYVEDKNGDESDGQDETIVPMDSDKSAGVKDITDDELKAWFEKLREHTSNITFIFDSCHSGTVTRGTGNKSIERDLKKNGTRGDPTAPTLNSNLDKSGDYVTISGSLPNEKSQEAPLPDLQTKQGERQNGYLTYYLVQELRQNRAVSYRDLMAAVSTAVTKKNPTQTPQIEGDVDRAFLGSKASRNKRGIKILKSDKEGKDTILTIEAGRITGALPDVTVGVYGENAVQLVGDENRIAAGRIESSDNFTAKVRVVETDVPAKAKIVLVNPFFTKEKRKVAIDTSGDAATRRRQNESARQKVDRKWYFNAGQTSMNLMIATFMNEDANIKKNITALQGLIKIAPKGTAKEILDPMSALAKYIAPKIYTDEDYTAIFEGVGSLMDAVIG